MKERLLDVVKWGLVLIIAGIVFYVVYPKYYFSGPQGTIWYRCNKITGKVDAFDNSTGWKLLQKKKSRWVFEDERQKKKP